MAGAFEFVGVVLERGVAQLGLDFGGLELAVVDVAGMVGIEEVEGFADLLDLLLTLLVEEAGDQGRGVEPQLSPRGPLDLQDLRRRSPVRVSREKTARSNCSSTS